METARIIPMPAAPAPVEPQVLRPFHRAEAIDTKEAARLAGRTVRTVERWCVLHNLGRRINGGAYAVSRVAFAMFLDGNREALALYLSGDRTAPIIRHYFQRCDAPLPRCPHHEAARAAQ